MNKSAFKIKEENGKEYIYDINRKKYVMLTAEEWVRQQILHYLIYQMNYPAAVISVEKQILVGSVRKRYDLVIYKESRPWLLIECKHENEKLHHQTLRQLLAYQSNLQVEFLTMTNGRQIMTYEIREAKWIDGFPSYT